MPTYTCFVHCSHQQVIFGFQSTASQSIGSGRQVDGGGEPAARSDSLPPDSEGERGKKYQRRTYGLKKHWGK